VPHYDVQTPAGQRWVTSEAELRALVREYRDEHGEDAAARDLVIIEMPETRTGNGRRLDVSHFFDR